VFGVKEGSTTGTLNSRFDFHFRPEPDMNVYDGACVYYQAREPEQ